MQYQMANTWRSGEWVEIADRRTPSEPPSRLTAVLRISPSWRSRRLQISGERPVGNCLFVRTTGGLGIFAAPLDDSDAPTPITTLKSIGVRSLTPATPPDFCSVC
jgi:hypothetical protein